MLEDMNILIIDDEKSNCLYLREILVQHGFQNIYSYLDPVYASQQLKLSYKPDTQMFYPSNDSIKYDLILLDAMMPILDGFQLCKLIKTELNLPVIMITALDNIAQHVQGIEAGADDVIVKPVVTPKLIARIKILLKKKQEEDQRQSNLKSLQDTQRSLPVLNQVIKKDFAQYKNLSFISSGSSSSIYRAIDPSSNQPVAIKILNSELLQNPDHIRSFRKEIEINSKLSHPGIIKIHNYGFNKGSAFIVMNLIDGKDLAQAQHSDLISPEDKSSFAIQIGEVLHYIHTRNIIHRDIKLENIFMDSQGNIKLGDFGLSIYHDFDNQPDKLAGTPSYMAPEIFTNNQTTADSDTYAYGISLFSLFTGDLPFDGELYDIIDNHCNTPPPNLRDFNPTLKEGWYKLVDACLEKDPQKRPKDILEFTNNFDPRFY